MAGFRSTHPYTQATRRLLRLTSAFIVLAASGLIGCDRPTDDSQARSATPTDSSEPGESRAANQPASVNASQAGVQNGPYLQMETLSHDFGVMPEFETRSTALRFTNTGDEPLRILDISTTCGCTVAKQPMKSQYLPGESGEIEVTFDPTGPNDPGKPQKKYVNVVTNSSSLRTVQIMITADVQAFIDLEPRFVDLGELENGVAHHFDVKVSCPDPMFTIDAVHTTNPHVTTQVLDDPVPASETDNGRMKKTRIVRLTISPDAPWGRFFSWLQITVTGRPSPMADLKTHSSRIRVQGQIFGALAADPDTFRFGVERNESFERVIMLKHRSGQPFNVLSVDAQTQRLASVDVEPRRIAPDQWELIMHAVAGHAAGPSRGTITVHTDLTGDERSIELPVSGVVREPMP